MKKKEKPRITHGTNIVICDSWDEAKRFATLVLLEKANKISDLQDHPRFENWVNGAHQGHYTGDARFFEVRKENSIRFLAEVVEDHKGWHKNLASAIKSIKLTAALNPTIEFRIVDKHGVIKRHWINGIEQPRLRKKKLISPMSLEQSI